MTNIGRQVKDLSIFRIPALLISEFLMLSRIPLLEFLELVVDLSSIKRLK